MPSTPERGGRRPSADRPKGAALGPTITRRGLFHAAALAGLGIATLPARDALAWSSWTNVSSTFLKSIGMGDCVHEDLVQISYARALARIQYDPSHEDALINPWMGRIQENGTVKIAGDTVSVGGGKSFKSNEDLASRLYRENLVCLRIGSFWNDAAANTVADFGLSVIKASSIPKFQGTNRYEGAWAVAQHISQTHQYNSTGYVSSRCDALVQFTMNERNNFIHGLLSTAADGKTYFTHAEMKKYALQWLGVAYEYARTGNARAIDVDNVTLPQAVDIVMGFIDPYGQEEGGITELRRTLKVGSDEASRGISRRQKRLRALGMVCHTMEDFWCPSHTCRTYREGGQIPKYTVLAFSNYKKQNGTAGSMKGYHIPFDRYARTDYYESDLNNNTDWRRALTKGVKGRYVGTETLANVCNDDMYGPLQDAHHKFNTLGMNETIACLTKLFTFFLEDTPWDRGVRDWVDKEVLHTHFDSNGQAIVCDAGRRSLHSPTFLIGPINGLKRPCRKLKIRPKYDELLKLAKRYDQYQRWTHEFYSGKYNGNGSKYVTSAPKGKPYCTDAGAERTLQDIVRTCYDSFVSLGDADKAKFLALVGNNGCHKIVAMLENIGGMLHEFAIDLRGSDSPDSTVMSRLSQTIAFFKSGEKANSTKVKSQASPLANLIGVREALADEDDGDDGFYVTTDMEVVDTISYEDGSYLVALRDMDSLASSVMAVPAQTPGKDMLEMGATNLRITYTLVKVSDEDIDFTYLVTDIDSPADELPVSLAIGAVESVSEGLIAIAPDEGGVLQLQTPSNLDDTPEAGDYVCAYYTRDSNGTEHLLDYVELDRYDETDGGTYPVVRVYGSGMWVLDTYNTSDNYEVDGAEGGHAGNDNMIYIDFGSAKISPVPREGCMATVNFHNEYYYDAEDMFESDYSDGDLDHYSENEVVTYPDDASHPLAQSQADPVPFPAGTTADVFGPQADDTADEADLEDDADEAAYVEFNDYSDNIFNNEPLHVADTVQGTNQRIPDELLLQLYGEYAEDLMLPPKQADPGKPEDTTTYHYATNGDGTHRRYTTDPKAYTLEKCTYNSQGTCIHCGYVFKSQGGGNSSSNSGSMYPESGDWAWPRTRYPQVMGYTGSSWTGPRGTTYRSTTPTSSSSSSTSSGTSTPQPTTPSTPSTGGLLGGYTASGLTAPAADVAAAPAGGVVSTGVAAAPAAGAVSSPVAVLPNTADVAAGLDALMSVSAIAGAALTAHGLRRAARRQDSETAEEAGETAE